MFVAASTRCFSDLSFEESCQQITELEYDKVEIWMDESSDHLKPSEIARSPDAFSIRFRDLTRLTPIAVGIESDVDLDTFRAVARLAQQLRVTQITLPSSPLGTPFNAEIDRLRDVVRIAGEDGTRVSIKTKTGQLTEDPHTAVELCQAVPGLGLTLDPSYYICGAKPDLTFDQVFPHVYHVNLRDTTPEQIQVRIGLGQVEYSRLISQLQRQGYSLALSVEVFPEMLGDMDRGVELRKMRLLLESLL